MYIIAITGGIACGKSVVSREIRKFGAEIISADAIAHELSEPGQPIYDAYVEHFGREILDPYGRLDRRAIGRIVFNDLEQRKWINQTTHPMLLNRVREKLVEFQERGLPIAVLDVPLLFEAGWDYLADEIWVVWLNKKKQLSRLMYRNRLSLLEATARINAQMNVYKKRARADVVISNNRTRPQLKALIQRIMRRKFPHLKRHPTLKDELAHLARVRAQRKWTRELERQLGESDEAEGSPIEMIFDER